MQIPSKLVDDAVNAFATLPGIGKKTALRMVLHLLKQNEASVSAFSNAIETMRAKIQYCTSCNNFSDAELCIICENPMRSSDTICVVETIRDLLAIENTGQFQAKYHVLGGVISPLEGVGPDELSISKLVERVQRDKVSEIIMALSPTMEGDTTLFYISKQLKKYPVNITTISRGVAFSGELEYADDFTLARSIASRQPYENYLVDR